MRKLLLLVLCFASPAFGATPSIVQTTPLSTAYFGSTTSATRIFPNPTNPGDMILVLGMYNSGSAFTPTDTQLDSFSACNGIFPFTATTSFTVGHCFVAQNIAGGSSTTMTFTFSPGTFAEFIAIEISGQVGTGSPVDVVAAANGTSGICNSGSATTTAADLVIGFCQGNGNQTWTATGGFTSLGSFNSTNAIVMDLSQGAAGSVSASATASSNNWTGMMVAIKGSTATLVSIAVTPGPASVIAASTLQFTATGTYSDSSHHVITGSVTWASTNTAAATIASGGLATGVAAGTTTISATLAPGTPGTSLLTVTPQIYDIYGGLISLSCTNANTVFTLVNLNVPSHGVNPLFCDVLGHPLFSRGFYGLDVSLETQNDESGHSGVFYLNAKYGSINNALNQVVAKSVFWGMNTAPPFEHNNQKAPANPTTKVPYVQLLLSSEYALGRAQQLGWAAISVHDLMYFLKGSDGAGPSNWNGQKPSGMADWRDPNFLATIQGIFAHDNGITALASASAANKAYVLGFSPDESDGTHCLGAGPNFATNPVGNNDYSCGYVWFFIPPVSWANPHQGEIYPSGQVYMKSRMQTLMTTAHTNFAGVNTAWGSSYTTMGTSGECIGADIPVSPCGSSAAAEAYGTGTGVQVTFNHTLANTTVSGYSVGIFVAGVLVGGDTGAGAFYGPNLTGSLNYTTGVASITFAAGHAPANGAAITVEYIANGWGIGTGFMDEDCRAGHASYCGNGSNNTTIYFCSTPPSTGCLPANVQTDLNALTVDWTTFYASTFTSALCTWAGANGFTGCPVNIGPTTTGTWATPSSASVLQGLSAGGQQAYSYGGTGQFSQAELNFVNANAPNMPLIAGTYRTSNANSAMSWPNSPATKSGSTATATVVAPNTFTSLPFIDITCTDSSYNAVGIHPSSATSTSVTWTPTITPASASTTCNLFYDDANTGGYPTMAARATAFQIAIFGLVTSCYSSPCTTSSFFPYAGYYWWTYGDTYSGDPFNWGATSYRDNDYDGVENVTATVSHCNAPMASFSCGGEIREGQGGGTIAAIVATNAFIDCTLTNTCTGPPPPTNPVPAPCVQCILGQLRASGSLVGSN